MKNVLIQINNATWFQINELQFISFFVHLMSFVAVYNKMSLTFIWIDYQSNPVLEMFANGYINIVITYLNCITKIFVTYLDSWWCIPKYSTILSMGQMGFCWKIDIYEEVTISTSTNSTHNEAHNSCCVFEIQKNRHVWSTFFHFSSFPNTLYASATMVIS